MASLACLLSIKKNYFSENKVMPAWNQSLTVKPVFEEI